MPSSISRPALVAALVTCLIGPPILAAGDGSVDEPAGVRSRPTIGIAFSGGGAKGCAHIGVLQVFEEMGIPVDYVGGTSMGAIIGGLYAAGYSADDLAELMRSIDWAEAMRDRPPRSALSFRRKQESLRYPFDLELGLRDGEVLWPRGLSAGQNLFFLLRSFTLPVADVEDFDALPIPFRAVAADIQTGEKIVLERGDLAKALRASMAIPGFFTPVDLDGRTLVDGGVIDNLPIDIVRSMGADIVIAVALGDPLAEGDIDSMMDILGQTQAMLTKRNVDPQLPRADLVLRPAVADFDLLNFEVADAIIAAGVEAAREQVDALRPYAMVEPYRGTDRRPPAPTLRVDRVRIEGDTRVDEAIVAANLDLRTGELLDFDRLAEGITRLYRLGDFESIEYTIEPAENGTTDLVLQIRDKPWGPNYLHFGLQLQADLDGELALGLLGNYTATRFDTRGSEWRVDVELGTDRRLSTELYRPLDIEGTWFLAPSLMFGQDRSRLFDDGTPVADLDVRQSVVRLDLGRQFDARGEIRLGVERGRADVSLASGSVANELADVDYGAIVFEATFDHLDRVVLPRHGDFAKLRVFHAEEELGGDDAYTKLSFEAVRFRSRGVHTFFAGFEGGWSPGGGLPLYDEFRVGGLLSFSGFQDDELRGQEFAVARVGYARQVRSGGALARRVVLGGWLEAGNVWTADDDLDVDDLAYSLTLGVGADTLVGPVYLAYGIADEGSGRFYLGIGRSF